ncbi:hypothetical protein PPERSA_08865 [Pseudocohnilembus persalinus]|uniref:Uncharacterized protein n=1 Tax=Pseudocohnilembus persalinus TaxID=266149 RepID=A0A0V0R3T2_PSEPJ|nr:hypothetical protein PPERSA_08865 [Pseudocohnilembus persalinus]|eukprot:KRX09149.1 hypothetical protein PPERSA_08865 [Pseudocohnilembus persalinus]
MLLQNQEQNNFQYTNAYKHSNKPDYRILWQEPDFSKMEKKLVPIQIKKQWRSQSYQMEQKNQQNKCDNKNQFFNSFIKKQIKSNKNQILSNFQNNQQTENSLQQKKYPYKNENFRTNTIQYHKNGYNCENNNNKNNQKNQILYQNISRAQTSGNQLRQNNNLLYNGNQHQSEKKDKFYQNINQNQNQFITDNHINFVDSNSNNNQNILRKSILDTTNNQEEEYLQLQKKYHPQQQYAKKDKENFGHAYDSQNQINNIKTNKLNRYFQNQSLSKTESSQKYFSIKYIGLHNDALGILTRKQSFLYRPESPLRSKTVKSSQQNNRLKSGKNLKLNAIDIQNQNKAQQFQYIQKQNASDNIRNKNVKKNDYNKNNKIQLYNINNKVDTSQQNKYHIEYQQSKNSIDSAERNSFLKNVYSARNSNRKNTDTFLNKELQQEKKIKTEKENYNQQEIELELSHIKIENNNKSGSQNNDEKIQQDANQANNNFQQAQQMNQEKSQEYQAQQINQSIQNTIFNNTLINQLESQNNLNNYDNEEQDQNQDENNIPQPEKYNSYLVNSYIPGRRLSVIHKKGHSSKYVNNKQFYHSVLKDLEAYNPKQVSKNESPLQSNRKIRNKSLYNTTSDNNRIQNNNRGSISFLNKMFLNVELNKLNNPKRVDIMQYITAENSLYRLEKG